MPESRVAPPPAAAHPGSSRPDAASTRSGRAPLAGAGPEPVLGGANRTGSGGRPGQGHPAAATAIALGCWGLAAATALLVAVSRPPFDESLWFLLVDVTVACVYGTVAAVTLARRSHPVPWLLALAATGGGLAGVGYAYETWAWQPGGPPSHPVLAELQNTAWIPGTLGLFLVVPWLVRDHRLPWAGRGLVALGGVLSVVLAVLSNTESEVFYPLLTVAIALGLVAAAEVEWRRRRGPVAERNGLGWLALGTVILAASFVPVLLPFGATPIWTTPALHLASQAVFPAAVLVAVLRNRMWGLDLMVSRAVLAGLLTAGLLAVYLVVTALLADALPGSGAAHLLGAGAVAVLVQPLRLHLTRSVHRLVHGEASDPARVVRRLGSQLAGPATTAELLAGLAEDVGRSMRLESVGVSAAGLEPVRWGVPTGVPLTVPLRHRGEDVGTLAVTARPGESLAPRDVRTLGELSSVLAAALAVAHAAADLDDLRERLARARLEERRVIRREVHDGLGPTLAGIGLGLRAVGNLLADDPAAARELLARLREQVDAAGAGVRDLSRHLLPPALDELGLGAALAELAARYDGSALRVRVEAPHTDELDPRVAAAAYAIAAEAVTNVARHAGATTCLVRVRRAGAGLELEVRDDGRGIGPGAVAGVGSRSMRERAAELGGSLEVAAAPGGGTLVRASLPGAGDD